VLDANDNPHIRNQAIHAISVIGDADHRQRLKPLLISPESEDPDDQLRGYALLALWPQRLILLDDTLAAIRQPRRPNFYGSYQRFIDSEFAKYLRSEEIPVIFKRMQDIPIAVGNESGVIAKLADVIVAEAWKHLDDDAICVALADCVLQRIEKHQPLFMAFRHPNKKHHKVFSDVEERRRLTKCVIERAKEEPDISAHLLYWEPFTEKADLAWVVQCAVDAKDGAVARKFARLALFLFTSTEEFTSSDNTSLIIEAAESNATIKEAFAPWLTPIDIDGPIAVELRERHEKNKQQTQQLTRTPVQPPMTERVKEWLVKVEMGDPTAWWRLNHCMLFDECGMHGGHTEQEGNLRELPGWKDADAATRCRIVKAAATYLMDGEPNNKVWLGISLPHRPASAGYRALVLLAFEDRKTFQSLPSSIWKKWASSILDFPVPVAIADDVDLVAMAYEHTPDEVLTTINTIIDHENRNSGYLSILHRIENCWDDRLCAAMLAKLDDPSLKPTCVHGILAILLEQKYLPAKRYAETLLNVPLPKDARRLKIAELSAVALATHTSDAGWEKVWPAIKHDNNFGKAIVEAVAQDWRQSSRGEFAACLTEDQIADLYAWIEHHYPDAEDPENTSGIVSLRQQIAYLRESIIHALQHRGTPAAVKAMERLVSELPRLPWLRDFLLRTRNQTLRQTWNPPSPAAVLELCTHRDSRLIRNAQDLQNVLIEAFQKINVELQGETPAASDLWNRPTGPRDNTPTRPCNEEQLSDWLKRQLNTKLNDRGVTVLREVEIRRGEGKGENKGKGEITDLYATCSVAGITGPVRVIIEVKGCWNQELKTALKNQLVERYLKDNDCRSGIYVVGWFACPQWDDTDPRHKATAALSWKISEAAQFFDEQAADLCAGDIRVQSVVLNAGLR